MSGHTPGPWWWKQEAPITYRDLGHWFADGEVGSIMSGNRQVCCFGDNTVYNEAAGEAPDQMDLVLIMAAPEMLSAIEQFEAWWQEVGQVSFNGAPACVFALREAAAKARGGV